MTIKHSLILGSFSVSDALLIYTQIRWNQSGVGPVFRFQEA